MYCMQSYLVAVVVPEKHELEAAAKQLGVNGSYEEICKDKKVGCALPDNS